MKKDDLLKRPLMSGMGASSLTKYSMPPKSPSTALVPIIRQNLP